MRLENYKLELEKEKNNLIRQIVQDGEGEGNVVPYGTKEAFFYAGAN